MSWISKRVGVKLLATALVCGMALLIAVGVELSDRMRPLAVRYAEARWHRSIQIAGAFRLQWLSRRPRIVAEQVVVGNPPWTQPGTTAEIGRLELTFHLPWFGRSFGMDALRLDRATFNLVRDERGRANWQAVDPGTGQGDGPPLIRSLSIPDAAVHLDDRRRHLRFDGTVSTVRDGGPRLGFLARGQLNGRTAELHLTGDALASARKHQPYHFEYTAQSAGSRLAGHGSLDNPYDFSILQTDFEATGADLKDLYFLTGVTLPDTGAYRLTGRFLRKGDHLEFDHLEANSGGSDLLANIAIEAHLDSPSHIEADLGSRRLRLSDLGERAAGRAPAPDPGQLVLPARPFRLTGVRGADAVIRFRATRLEAGHATFREAHGIVRIEHGLIDASPLKATLDRGELTGRVRIDATPRVPVVSADVRVSHLSLDQLHAEGRPQVLDGAIDARITLEGSGDSVHQIAAGANGKLTAVLPEGAVRSSLAESAGLDLNSLGLLATRSQRETAIRCGVADFDLRNGTLSARTLIVDSEPVVISGEGTIDLGSETLDLRLTGRPKHPRLRVRSPVLVRGTIRQPDFSIRARNPLVQAGGAIALGALLTPAAALLAFVDPGLAKNQDCAALLAHERRPLEGVKQPDAAPPSRP